MCKASVELFFNIFTSGIETFVISWDQLLYPCAAWDWNHCVILCHFENANAERTGIPCGVRKDRPQELSVLTTCGLHCVLVSVALAPTSSTIFWTTGAPWQFCATRSRKSAGNDCGSADDEFPSTQYSVHSNTLSQTALNTWRELE